MRWRRKPAGIDTERNCVAVSLPAYKLLLLDTATPVCTHATPVYAPHLCVHTPHLCTCHTCVHATPVCTHATPVYTRHTCVYTHHTCVYTRHTCVYTPVRLPQVWCVLGKHFRPEVDVLSLTCSDADSDRPPWSRCPSAVSAVSDPGGASDAWWSSDCHELTTDVISILSRRASRCVYTIR